MDCPLCERPIMVDPEAAQGFCFSCNEWVTAYPDVPEPYRYTPQGRPYRPRRHRPDGPPGGCGGQSTSA
ncbi:hypothetical protein ABH930_004372 [Kitasatospora sp. GAS204A]